MYSVYLRSTASCAGTVATDSAAAEKQARLQGVVRLGRIWLEGIPADDPRREHLIRMGVLAENLVRAADHSPAAMAMARALLCANCRRFDAAQETCPGLSLDQCRLLKT
ncbi:MAG: hypothetical protein Q8M11_17790 [Sulfuritalea sp.]|nr:hypothetical protein [Sulfuritalea sp.]MDP1982233.1 hypothetical protein [Sulfuritalea sp.]